MTHEDDKTLAEALAAARSAGRACVLATIVGTRGSTPRKVGARMLVDATKQVSGTAGDYQVEGAERVATLNIGGSTATTACFVVEAAPTV